MALSRIRCNSAVESKVGPTPPSRGTDEEPHPTYSVEKLNFCRRCKNSSLYAARSPRRRGGTQGPLAIASESLLARLHGLISWRLRFQSYPSEIRRRCDVEFFNRIGHVQTIRRLKLPRSSA